MEIPKGGMPVGTAGYWQSEPRPLEIEDHFKLASQPKEFPNDGTVLEDSAYLHSDKKDYLIKDPNDPTDKTMANVPSYTFDVYGNKIPKFAGSATDINPLNDKTKDEIIQTGLDVYETKRVRSESGSKTKVPPFSVLQPFTGGLSPEADRTAILTTYNRTLTPVADVEFRKGFRNIFISRPECYIMARATSGTEPILSEQAEHDEDFSSAYSNCPHLLKLLSPVYVTGSFTQNTINHNWNFLLSNRIVSMSGNPTTSVGTTSEQSMTSIEGYTVSTPTTLDSERGSSITIKFRDDKHLDVYRFIRLWILYEYKRYRGIFSPPYNGYQYRNGFLTGGSMVNGALIYHPYDRAEEYMASLFDIYTNESMTKMTYWCKYYGIYPTEVSLEGTGDEGGGPIGMNGVTVTATFKYHRKLEYSNTSLVEFNYITGITDDMGHVTKSSLTSSQPFLLKDDLTSAILKEHVGAAGMFVGSPYIILGKSGSTPLNSTNGIDAYLQFMGLDDGILNDIVNVGITNVSKGNSKDAIGTI